MDDTPLILIVLFGIAVLVAIQGYSLLMQGISLLNPEQRQRNGGRFVYVGIALVLLGSLVAVLALVMFILSR